MESDSDHFESADEEFLSDVENEDNKLSILKIEPKKNETPPTILQIKNVTLNDSNEKTTTSMTVDSNKILEKSEVNQNVDNNTSDRNTGENNSNLIEKSKPRVIERRERPQKREPKTKLVIKLGTKLNAEDKNEAFWQAYTEAKKNEYAVPPQRVTCWEKELNDPQINKNKKSSDLYSEKSNEPEQNFWDNEENYMELPREDKTEFNQNKQETKEESSWGGWGNWGGMSSLLSVSTISNITSTVSQGVTKVLETGIGIPDPEELAKSDREKETVEKEIQDEIDTKTHSEEQDHQRVLGFGLGNFVSSVSHITKLVETTGSKVLTGGLDTLEVIGKKTMEVLQEGDPGLKKKRALFKIDQNKPVLSQILREAKEKAEQEDKINEGQMVRKPHYETIFDDYQGLVHLEALEMLSKQCDIKLEALIESLKGSALQDMQETMAQIKELCELPDEEEDNSLSDIEVVREKVETAINEMNVQITYDHFIETWSDIDNWLQENNDNVDEVHQKAIESLAQLTAIAVEQFHKAGELLLVKDRRSTVDEADSLVQLTITLTGVVGAVAGKFSEKLNTSVKDSDENVNSLITNIFLEAANSSTYMQDAFNLLIPVLQVGAI